MSGGGGGAGGSCMRARARARASARRPGSADRAGPGRQGPRPARQGRHGGRLPQQPMTRPPGGPPGPGPGSRDGSARAESRGRRGGQWQGAGWVGGWGVGGATGPAQLDPGTGLMPAGRPGPVHSGAASGSHESTGNRCRVWTGRAGAMPEGGPTVVSESPESRRWCPSHGHPSHRESIRCKRGVTRRSAAGKASESLVLVTGFGPRCGTSRYAAPGLRS